MSDRLYDVFNVLTGAVIACTWLLFALLANTYESPVPEVIKAFVLAGAVVFGMFYVDWLIRRTS